MATKDAPIKKFGSKLMTASRSINKIPYEYLTLARDARIFDGGIGPRRGKISLVNSTLGTVNQGGFLLNDRLYQIANNRIYEVDKVTGVQTERANLGYDQRVDVLVYQFPRGNFQSEAEVTHTFSSPGNNRLRRFRYLNSSNVTIEFEREDGTSQVFDQFTNTANVNRAIPVLKVLDAGTDGNLLLGTGGGTRVGNDVILDVGDFVDNVGFNADPADNDLQVQFGYFEAQQSAIIVSNNGSLRVFDGETITNTQNIDNNGVIEYARGFSFLGQSNNLLISAPITSENPENAYDFTGTSASSVQYDSNILGLQGTLNGLYVFTENRVEFLGSNALQNIAGSATFISTPLGESGALINNQCVANIGDKIFYITKDLQIQSINYIGGTDSPQIGELSQRPVIGIKELLNNIDESQPYAYAFQNKKDKTVQFHVRTINSRFNDVTIIYDFINDTWSVDTNKNYNWIVEDGNRYFGFSDVNTSIYIDDEGNSDAGIPIPFLIRTQNMNLGTLYQKRYVGFYTSGAIGALSQLDYRITVDGQEIFIDSIEGNNDGINSLGEIGVNEIGVNEIGGPLSYELPRQPFDRTADQGRIFIDGVRIQIEISSNSQIQDYLIDMLGYAYEPTPNIDISSKF